MFSDATGLRKKSKCKVFFRGTREVVQQDILKETGFERGKLSFKYMGVPLDRKRLSSAAYTPLVEKVVARLKHLTGKLLTYAGRLQLTRSVITTVVLSPTSCNCSDFR